jgi:DNA polymerase-3 subunit alpha
MCREVDLSGMGCKPLESLIKVGALDRFGDRSALLAVVDRILALAQSEARLRDSGQTTMFDLFGETVPTPLASIELDDVTTPDKEKWGWERELLGVSVSAGPALSVEADGDSEAIAQAGQLRPEMNGKQVVLAGQVSRVTERFTRDQRPFLIATLDLMDGAVEVLVWENLIKGTRSLWEEGTLVVVTGKVRARGDQVSISCSQAHEYQVAGGTEDESQGGTAAVAVGNPATLPEAVAAQGGTSNGTAISHPAAEAASTASGPTNGAAAPRRLSLRIQETDRPSDDQMLLEDMRRVLLDYRGEDEVELEIATDGRIVTMGWPLVRVNACSELEHRLRDLLGQAGTVSVSDVP